MSDRYRIDKILEKPKQHLSETSENFRDDADVIREKEMSLIQIRSEEHRIEDKRSDELRSSDDREKSSILVHMPRDVPRSYSSDPHRHISSFCYPRKARCYCPGCSQESVPPWLRRAPSPQYVSVDKRLGPRAYIHHPYSIRNERDYAPLSNNSLATRTRQQSSSRTTGGSKKKKRHRTAFTPTQLLGLENSFEQSHYSVGEERKQLAAFLGLSETQIKVWFQNRRTKWKRIRKEAEEEDSDEEEAEGEPCYEASYAPYETHRHYHNSGHHENAHGHEAVLAYQKRWPSHHPWAGDHRYPF